MKLQPKTPEEAMNLIYNILNQGDSRYNAPEHEQILAKFILNNAISIEKLEISNISELEDQNIFSLEIQAKAKHLMKEFLKLRGFQENEIFFERRFRGSQPDVYAKSGDRLILGEAYSCRVSKIIDFLSEAEEVLVVTRGDAPWDKIPHLGSKMELFTFKKSVNWNNTFSRFQQLSQDQIKKVKSPLDRL